MATELTPNVPDQRAAEGDLVVLRQALDELHREVNARVESAVFWARTLGCSWADIGRSLGISRQAAHARFRHTDQFSVTLYAGAGRRPWFVLDQTGDEIDTRKMRLAAKNPGQARGLALQGIRHVVASRAVTGV